MTRREQTATEARPQPEYPSGYPRLFWVGLAVGGLIMGNGVRGLVVNRIDTLPRRWLLVAGVGNLVHDFLLVPAVILVGLVVRRLVPSHIRPAIQGGLICTGVVALFAFPFVRGYGLQPDNPTILSRNYAAGLAIVLASVWVVTAVVAARAWRRWARS